MEQQKAPNATLILVLGILSIPTCLCYGLLGIILGVIAIVLAINSAKEYSENPEIYTDIQNVKVGKILGIIGITLGLLYIAFIYWAITTFGWETMQNQELMQERLREYFGR